MDYSEAVTLFPLAEAGYGYQATGCFERDRPPRKGHKKSRRGCYECKRRKIKCQETHPSCSNCIRLSLRCRYHPDSASVVTRSAPLLQPFSSLQIANVFSLTDIRLFHHFLVAAWPHLPVRADNVWLEYVVPIGHQCEYLMHAMLALSASHLSKLTPSALLSIAQTHRLHAISGLNAALSNSLLSTADGDAAIATCYALLMQSWYMDDGLPASLILTRSVHTTTRWVREQRVCSLLACDDEGTRVAGMKGRLRDAPAFDRSFVDGALEALKPLEDLCEEGYQKDLFAVLKDAYWKLGGSPVACYDTYVSLDTFLSTLPSLSLNLLLSPTIQTNQLLLAFLVALHLVMRPISCRERRQYTVSFYGIRMSSWIPGIWNEVAEEARGALEWPMWVKGKGKFTGVEAMVR
ncbi:hypothetical protein BKA65DRAFT_598120 [Rhexocercosporidium sp. MPI-PUGE-AT-0058]|nr:hypothetical protein BKA65DRAFT_598120 [Rhexocercosporidium sp. MPI-PUGE-AT-0058]